jgi:mRNA interferase RelE/StbE
VNYRIIILSSAQREIDKLPQDVRRRVVARILSLEQDPRPHGAIKLEGAEAYRVRVGDYRVVYTMSTPSRTA